MDGAISEKRQRQAIVNSSLALLASCRDDEHDTMRCMLGDVQIQNVNDTTAAAGYCGNPATRRVSALLCWFDYG